MALNALDFFLLTFCSPEEIANPSEDFTNYGLTFPSDFVLINNLAQIYRINSESFPIIFDNLSIPALSRPTDGVYIILGSTENIVFFAGLGTSSFSRFTDYTDLITKLREKIGTFVWDNYSTPVAQLNNNLLGWYELTTSLNDLAEIGVSFNEIRTTPLTTYGAYFGTNDLGVLHLPYRDSFATELAGDFTVSWVTRWDNQGVVSNKEDNMVRRWNFFNEVASLNYVDDSSATVPEEEDVIFNVYKKKGNGVRVEITQQDNVWADRLIIDTPDGLIVDDRDFLFVLRVSSGVKASFNWYIGTDPTVNVLSLPFTNNNPIRNRKIGFTLGSQQFQPLPREFLKGKIRKFGVWGRYLADREVPLLWNLGRYVQIDPVSKALIGV